MKQLFQQIKNRFNQWLNGRRYAACARQAAKIVRQVKAQWPGCDSAMNTATWPPVSGTTTGFTVKGKTTIQWGTDGLLSSPYPSGGGFYTVLRISQRQVFERTKLPNGTGPTTSDVFVQDGNTWTLTVRDDSGMTPPTLNTTVTLVDGAGFLGTVGQVYTARVVDPSWESALKEAGTRELVCDSLLLVDSQTGSAQTAR